MPEFFSTFSRKTFRILCNYVFHQDIYKANILFTFSETIICEQDSLCLEYMMINRTRSTRNLEVRHVSSHSVADDDITVEYSGRPGSYVNNCNNYNFNFTPYQNPDSEANKSYAPWKYVINRHANR